MGSPNLEELADRTSAKLLNETTELAQLVQHFDKDDLDNDTHMSSIDFNANLTHDQAKLSTMIDVLERMGIFPANTGLTRQVKRLSTSILSLGREQKIRMIQAERSQRSGNTMGGAMANMFKPAN